MGSRCPFSYALRPTVSASKSSLAVTIADAAPMPLSRRLGGLEGEMKVGTS